MKDEKQLELFDEFGYHESPDDEWVDETPFERMLAKIFLVALALGSSILICLILGG